jgi:hypothetical protein
MSFIQVVRGISGIENEKELIKYTNKQYRNPRKLVE